MEVVRSRLPTTAKKKEKECADFILFFSKKILGFKKDVQCRQLARENRGLSEETCTCVGAWKVATLEK
jgi:hypothetical protein